MTISEKLSNMHIRINNINSLSDEKHLYYLLPTLFSYT